MSNFSKTPQVCLDTNIVICLANFSRGLPEDIATLKHDGSYKSIEKLYFLIKNEKIMPIITTMVLKEILQGISFFGTNTSDFVKNNHIYVLELDSRFKKEFYENVEQLAITYCQPVKHNTLEQIARYNFKNVKTYTPNVFYFLQERKKQTPLNDSRVMAQSACLGIPLITNDYKDYIKDNRPDIIAFLNSRHKLRPSAIPYTSLNFLQHIKEHTQFPTMYEKYTTQIIPSNECELLR